MKKKNATGARAAVMAGLLTLALAGCGASASGSTQSSSTSASDQSVASDVSSSKVLTSASNEGVLNTSELFTDRDLQQTADTSQAKAITVEDGKDVSITEEGVYVLKGTAKNATVTVSADSNAKVQLVLDGLNLQNTNKAGIVVYSADKVFVTTTAQSTNTIEVSGTIASDAQANVDAAIFSKDDLVLNGTGTLQVTSSQNGVSSHDDLKITGGTYTITSTEDALEANDDVLIADGNITIDSQKDGIHAENSDDDTKGNVYMRGGSATITATDDGIQATAALQVDGGITTITSAEGLEATYVQINDGSVHITATDDGINGSNKSSAYSPKIDIRGGDVTVEMGSGDTDALDVNGDLSISGGTVDISAQFAFDFDGTAELTGGTVYVNGEQISTIENSMMGGGMGGPGGGMSGRMMGDDMADGGMMGGQHMR